MALSKQEIQQMLREMNVRFNADDTYEALKRRLQIENHSLWLKSVSGNWNNVGRPEKILVRKRKRDTPASCQATNPKRVSSPAEASEKPIGSAKVSKSAPAYRPRPIQKPVPGQPWKAVADGTEPFNAKDNVFASVLRRARMCCEGCGIQAGEGLPDIDLQPYLIKPLSQGGEHCIKNVVALCSACRQMLEADHSAKTIKALKRKTRSKMYDSLQVVRKKKVCNRHSIKPLKAGPRRPH